MIALRDWTIDPSAPRAYFVYESTEALVETGVSLDRVEAPSAEAAIRMVEGWHYGPYGENV